MYNLHYCKFRGKCITQVYSVSWFCTSETIKLLLTPVVSCLFRAHCWTQSQCWTFWYKWKNFCFVGTEKCRQLPWPSWAAADISNAGVCDTNPVFLHKVLRWCVLPFQNAFMTYVEWGRILLDSVPESWVAIKWECCRKLSSRAWPVAAPVKLVQSMG